MMIAQTIHNDRSIFDSFPFIKRMFWMDQQMIETFEHVTLSQLNSDVDGPSGLDYVSCTLFDASHLTRVAYSVIRNGRSHGDCGAD